MKTPLLAFHGDLAIKKKYLARVRAHRKADELIHGTYWENGKGCAVGCTIHSSDHSAFERELGIPRILARLEDGIFEGLDNGESQKWPERFLQAIPIGVSLLSVSDKFLHWLLVDKDDGVIRFARTEKSKKAISDVGELYQRKIAGEAVSEKSWRDRALLAWMRVCRPGAPCPRVVSEAAYDASASASAYAAAYAAYAAAAYAAAEAAYAASAAYAYASAAYADASADAAYAHAQARSRQADKLVELLKTATL